MQKIILFTGIDLTVHRYDRFLFTICRFKLVANQF